MLTKEDVDALLSYDPDTGSIAWRHAKFLQKAMTRPAGAEAGGRTLNGYITICIKKKPFYAHRLAWLLTHGEWPSAEVDHINGDRSDNRAANLRLATQQQNQWNRKVRRDSSSGVKGVRYHKASGRWYASIVVSRKVIALGYHETIEQAAAAYSKAAKLHFGEFARAA